jgi:phage-related protein
MSDPITSIFNCQMVEMGAPLELTIKFPGFDTPGLKNLARAVIASVIETLSGLIAFIKQYVTVPPDPKKLATIATDILKFPEAIIKKMVDVFISKLKLPDLAAMVKQSISSAMSAASDAINSVVIPVVDFTKVFVDAMTSMFAGSNPLDAIKTALAPIGAAVSGAIGNVKNAVSWVSSWIETFAKLLLSFLAVPLFILKAAVDFITKKFTELAGGFTSMADAIITTLKDAIISFLSSMGMLPPGVKMPPVLQIFLCIIKQVTEILKGLPGNLVELSVVVA